MKRFVAVILALMMALSLCACGNSDGENSDVGASKSKGNAQPVEFGDVIETDFMTMTIEEVGVEEEVKVYSYGSNSSASIISSDEGEQAFFLKGTIENISSEKIGYYTCLWGEVVFNDTYKYPVKFDVQSIINSANHIPPLYDPEYYIYVDIPDKLAESIETYTLSFGFEENLDGSDTLTVEVTEKTFDQCKYQFTISGSLASEEDEGGVQTYYAKSDVVILDGEKLAREIVDPEDIWLVVDGDIITFSYYGEEYKGYRKSEGSQTIEWESEPCLIDGASLMMTAMLEVSIDDGLVGYDMNFDYWYDGVSLVHQVGLRK